MLSEVIRMNMVPWVQAEHPEWQDMNQPGGKPLKPEELAKSYVLGCSKSPYGDFFIRSQVALLKTFDYDGYNLDGFGCWSQCYCPACKQSYKEDTGGEIPVGTDMNNSAWRHYVKWRLWRYTAFVLRWTAALKAVKPDFVRRRGRLGRAAGALDGGRPLKEAMRCTASWTRRFSNCFGIFRPIRGAVCPIFHASLLPRSDGRPPGVDSRY